MSEREHIKALIQSNDQLRAVLILAGKELGKQSITGERLRRMLEMMRETVREGRVVVSSAR